MSKAILRVCALSLLAGASFTQAADKDFGEFFAAVTFKPASTGCAEGSYRLAVSRQWGEQLSFDVGDCWPVSTFKFFGDDDEFLPGGAVGWGLLGGTGLLPSLVLNRDTINQPDQLFTETQGDLYNQEIIDLTRFPTTLQDGDYRLVCAVAAQPLPYGFWAAIPDDIRIDCKLGTATITSDEDLAAAAEGIEAALSSGLLESNPIVIKRIPPEGKKIK